jgi:preprotein translocase subunit SecB
LIGRANLLAIRFIKFDLRIDLPYGTSIEQVELSTKAKSDGRLEKNIMLITFDLRLRGKDGEQTVIDVGARIEARYEIPDEEEGPSAGEMKAFAKTNGMLNVWPYWREYVQSASLRAGLPPLTLPLFRVIHEATKRQN